MLSLSRFGNILSAGFMTFRLRKIIAIASLISALSFYNSANAANCYTASGWGTVSVDGFYQETADSGNANVDHGVPVYTNGTFYVWKYSGNSTGFIGNATYFSSGTGNVEYITSSYSTPDASTWVVADTGSEPIGTFTLDTCPTPPAATSTGFTSFGLWGAVATTTYALISDSGMPFWEIALGVLIALFLLFILLVGLSRQFKRLLKG